MLTCVLLLRAARLCGGVLGLFFAGAPVAQAASARADSTALVAAPGYQWARPDSLAPLMAGSGRPHHFTIAPVAIALPLPVCAAAPTPCLLRRNSPPVPPSATPLPPAGRIALGVGKVALNVGAGAVGIIGTVMLFRSIIGLGQAFNGLCGGLSIHTP